MISIFFKINHQKSFNQTGSKLKEIIENKCKLVFLPKYSPDLNPIEKKFVQIKAIFRKISYDFEDKAKALNYIVYSGKYTYI